MLRRVLTRVAAAIAVVLIASMLSEPAMASTPAPSDFVVTGEVEGLYPGIHTTLPAKVTNTQTFAIEVTSLDARAHDASADCPGSLLTFGPLTANTTIAPGATSTVSVSIDMDASANDACQGATWLLELHATAVSSDSSVPPTSAPGGVSPGPIPRTGADVIRVLAVGLGLIAIGLRLRPPGARRARRRSGAKGKEDRQP